MRTGRGGRRDPGPHPARSPMLRDDARRSAALYLVHDGDSVPGAGQVRRDARGADRPDPGRRRAHAGRRVAVNRCGQRTTGIEPESVMKQYLLSVYQPDGEPPPPEILEGIMRDVYAVQQQMKDAGAWVFTAGLHAAS